MAIFRTPPPPGAGGPEPAPSATELLRTLIGDIPRMIGERVQLLTLELQRAKSAFIVMAALVGVALLLLLTAWAVIWGAVIAGLIAAGMAWGWAVLIVLIVTLGGATGALLYAKSKIRLLALPATMRHLKVSTRRPGRAGDTPFTNPGAGAAFTSPTATPAPPLSPNFPRRPPPERTAP